MVSLRCCAMQLRKWRASLRVITVFIFLAIFAYDANWNVLTFSRTSGVPVTPWVYPAVFSDRYLMMCICLAVMVLFCDAPFLDRHQPYLILRSGRGHWALGTAGYLLASSAVVSASIFLMGMLLGMTPSPSPPVGEACCKVWRASPSYPPVSWRCIHLWPPVVWPCCCRL